MDRLKEFLDWNCENPHNVNFKMIVGKEDREETLKMMHEISELLDTGLTPGQIQELKERDIAKAPEIHKNESSDAYICPNCNLILIYKDEAGWFCGKRYSFCPDCGQRLKWEK